jgi:nucleoside phosphorylase
VMQEAPPPPRCEVVILTALGLEYKAVSEHLRDMQEITHQGTVYGHGTFTGQHCTWHVAVAEIGLGGPAAATETERAIGYFRPQITLFVGVGGGLKDVQPGHVVAASKVYAYESGKAGQQFRPYPEAWRGSYALEQRARAEARSNEWLTRLDAPHADPVPEVHIGALAAGEKVLASTNSHLFRLLKATFSDTLAVEMEGHGFLTAVHANQSVHALVIRGISNLIDDKSASEAAGSQIVAARHAAAFAFQVLAKFTLPTSESTLLPPVTQAVWNIPYSRNPVFTGREDILNHLSTSFETDQATAFSQPQAISGLGGIGKTQIVVEYAYRHAQDYEVVLWAHAESTEVLAASYATIATQLRLSVTLANKREMTIEAVKTWLQTHHQWLLILDNADDLDVLPPFLPPTPGGHILITTRAQSTGRLARRLDVEVLDQDTGALLLLRRAGMLLPDAPSHLTSDSDLTLAHAITQELGGLPLALDQAGAYIEETASSLEDYQRLYQTHRTTLLATRRDLVNDHPESVVTTWSLFSAGRAGESGSGRTTQPLCLSLSGCHPGRDHHPRYPAPGTCIGSGGCRCLSAQPGH